MSVQVEDRIVNFLIRRLICLRPNQQLRSDGEGISMKNLIQKLQLLLHTASSFTNTQLRLLNNFTNYSGINNAKDNHLHYNRLKPKKSRNMSRDARNRSSGFPTRSDTNRPVQVQKMARSLKICIYEEQDLYYLW